MPIRLRRRAEADLDDIYRYSLARWGRNRADRYLAEVIATFASIDRGQVIDRPAGVTLCDIRRAASGSHFIYFFRIEEDVQIVRILHQRMDPVRHLP